MVTVFAEYQAEAFVKMEQHRTSHAVNERVAKRERRGNICFKRKIPHKRFFNRKMSLKISLK